MSAPTARKREAKEEAAKPADDAAGGVQMSAPTAASAKAKEEAAKPADDASLFSTIDDAIEESATVAWSSCATTRTVRTRGTSSWRRSS